MEQNQLGSVWRTKKEKTGGNQEIDAFFKSGKNLRNTNVLGVDQEREHKR